MQTVTFERLRWVRRSVNPYSSASEAALLPPRCATGSLTRSPREPEKMDTVASRYTSYVDMISR